MLVLQNQENDFCQVCIMMMETIVNSLRIYQIKSKDSEIKTYSLCLANISKDFMPDDMKKQTGLKGIVKVFSAN